MITVYCILPVHKGDKHSYLLECLNSIDRLIIPTNTIFRLCFAIDGDLPTELEKIVIQYKQNNANLCRTFYNLKNRGLAKNLNNVIRAIKYDPNIFLMRMDADDINEPERLNKQLEFLIRCSCFYLNCLNGTLP